MSYGYKFVVNFRHGQGTQELYLNATDAEKTRMLRLLMSSADVSGVTVYNTVTVPMLSVISKAEQKHG